MGILELEEIEIKALIQSINAAAFRGSDCRLIAKLLDKLEESIKPSDDKEL